MDREKALRLLKSEQDNGDVEQAHGRADDVLCDLLSALGYQDVVAAYLEVPKWYA